MRGLLVSLRLTNLYETLFDVCSSLIYISLQQMSADGRGPSRAALAEVIPDLAKIGGLGRWFGTASASGNSLNIPRFISGPFISGPFISRPFISRPFISGRQFRVRQR